MSILDKHPAPWRHDSDAGELQDANGVRFSRAEYGGGFSCASPDVERLILAVPELLAALKRLISARKDMDWSGDAGWDDASAIIERIEKGGG